MRITTYFLILTLVALLLPWVVFPFYRRSGAPKPAAAVKRSTASRGDYDVMAEIQAAVAARRQVEDTAQGEVLDAIEAAIQVRRTVADIGDTNRNDV